LIGQLFQVAFGAFAFTTRRRIDIAELLGQLLEIALGAFAFAAGGGTGDISLPGSLLETVRVDVTVTAVADTPDVEVEATAVGTDGTTALDISTAVTDTDGSEEILSIEISDIPEGVVIITAGGTEFTATATDNNVTLSPSDLTDLSMRAPVSVGGDFSLTVTSTATDTDPDTGAQSTASNSATLPVTFDITATPPTLVVGDATGLEDNSIPLEISSALTNTDGSESISLEIDGIPEGATLTNTAGDTFEISSGSVTLTPAQLDGLAVTPPANSGVDFDLTVTATATESSSGATATTTGTITVAVDAVADAPTLELDGTAQVVEDGTVALDISSALTDLDGSESLSITIGGLNGATLNTGTVNTDGTVTISDIVDADGNVVTSVADQLSALTLSPAADSDVDLDLSVTAVATDTDPETGAETTATATGNIAVTIDAVADAPDLDVQDASGDEDTAIALDNRQRRQCNRARYLLGADGYGRIRKPVDRNRRHPDRCHVDQHGRRYDHHHQWFRHLDRRPVGRPRGYPWCGQQCRL